MQKGGRSSSKTIRLAGIAFNDREIKGVGTGCGTPFCTLELEGSLSGAVRNHICGAKFHLDEEPFEV